MPVRETVQEFQADLNKFAEVTKQNIQTVVRTVVFEIFRRVLMRTPVDTGRALQSWNVSKGIAGADVAPEVSAKDATLAAFHGLTLSAESLQYKVEDVSFDPPEGVYWIYNNLPYIQVLEFGLYPNPPKKGSYVRGRGYVIKSAGGFSIQAPQGMVRVAMAEVEAVIDAEIAAALIK